LKKNILIYSPKFFPSVGGLENLTLMLATEFKKNGNNVNIICFEKATELQCGLKVYYRPNLKKQIELFWNADVFYMPNFSLKGIWLLFFNPLKKWVVSHNNWYQRSDFTYGWQDQIKRILSYCVTNIAVSKAVASDIPAPSTLIHNCFDNHIFKVYPQINRNNDMLFVGRLVSDKGVFTLLEAIKILKPINEFKLSIVGDGPEKEKLVNFIQAENLEECVTFMGIKKGIELALIMNKHATMIIPSLWAEPYGIVALEGLACGCKIIASNKGGLPEAVDKFGLFFCNGNATELANCIMQWQDQNPTDILNKNELQQYLANHTKEKIAAKYLQVFFDR
jgi:glycogen synthase